MADPYTAPGPGVLLFNEATPASYPAQPGVAPEAYRAETTATTQYVQGVSESATAGVVEGGETYVPFGPALRLEQVEGEIVDPGFSWDWFGNEPRRTFRIAHNVGLMPLLRFAHSAKAGLDTDDLEGMAALYEMIRDTVHEDDWEAFQSYATRTKAEDKDLMAFVSAAMEVISARPQQRRGSSSATSPSELARSRGNSSQPGSVIPPGAIVPPEAAGLMPVSGLVK